VPRYRGKPGVGRWARTANASPNRAAGLFKELDNRGRLRVDDPSLAAQHFAWVTLGVPLDRGMFHPIDATTPTEEMNRIADAAVRVFIAAYASAPSARSLEPSGSPALRKKRGAAS
jgi:TetR/AcrR family transcriptional regulator, mexJK operon transcriptional repressor